MITAEDYHKELYLYFPQFSDEETAHELIDSIFEDVGRCDNCVHGTLYTPESNKIPKLTGNKVGCTKLTPPAEILHDVDDRCKYFEIK